MSRQSIEFCLHPPSPPRLPSVSTLLRETSRSPAPSEDNALPPLSPRPLPCPQINEPPELPPPALTVSIPNSPCSSPSMSSLPYHMDTPQSSPLSSPHPAPHLLLPPPCDTRRCRSLSSASTSSLSSLSSFSSPASPIHRRLSDPPLYSAFDHDPSSSWQPSVSPSSSSTSSQRPTSPPISSSAASIAAPIGNAGSRISSNSQRSIKNPLVLKRKRGRPPNATRHAKDNNWTFVTPTVWEVKRSSSTQHDHREEHREPRHPPAFDQPNLDLTVLHWPDDNDTSDVSGLNNGHNNPGPVGPLSMSNSSTSVRSGCPEALNNTFANTKMDTPLSMPRKKRGRKPKMQLAGNSCFVWRDLTARRGANRNRRRHDEDRLASRVEDLKL
ncbi:hypothetical protein BX666DRAFT_1873971 [Dichotomocladium elegans]|nr:hypothetical protein BX666DRAFT_1873971 [Dichotomocladium elegans]